MYGERGESTVMGGTSISSPACHINLAPSYRGGERQTELLLRELAVRGWPQRLVVRRGSPLATRCSDIEALEIVTVAPNQLSAGIAARGAALVHAHEARAVDSALFASLVYGIPYALTRRVVKPQKRSWRRALSYDRASAVVAVSAAVSTGLLERHAQVKPIVVPDAHASLKADETQVAAIRAAHPGKTLIGHVGALDNSHKGQLTIIEAARFAAERRPDWYFLLLGSGRDEARFREAMKGLENIELVGFVDNVGDYLSALDLFVFPSLHEAFGSTLVDAMYFGLPIVATRVGGIPEVVEDGVNGLLVEPEQAEQLFNAMVAILEDESRRSSMSLANRQKTSCYSVARMTDTYEEIYRRML